MESAYNEEKFKQHIRTVVQQAGEDTLEERPLTLPELKELAISMGMSEEEWDELQQKAHVHLKLAQDHLKARNFDQAIKDAEMATSINPYLPNSNSVLAKSYQMLWLEDDNTTARDKAEYYARKELLTDPDDKIAINVLSAINKQQKIGGKEKRSMKTYLIIGGVVAAIFLIIYGYSAMSSFSRAGSDLENELIVAQEEMNAKYDLLQTAMDQRNNMLPDLFNAVDGSHDDLNALNANISNLRSQLKNAEGEARFGLEDELEQKISDAKKLVRTYGNPLNTETLMIQIEGAENRISFERKAYIEAVKAYNILVKQSKGKFPEYELQPYNSGN